MKPAKRKKLEQAGFKVGSVQEFLDLSDEEMALIDLKVRLVKVLRSARESAKLTQDQLASLMASSQSRVAKMESAGTDVSLDLICKALFALGVSRKTIAQAIAAKTAA